MATANSKSTPPPELRDEAPAKVKDAYASVVNRIPTPPNNGQGNAAAPNKSEDFDFINNNVAKAQAQAMGQKAQDAAAAMPSSALTNQQDSVPRAPNGSSGGGAAVAAATGGNVAAVQAEAQKRLDKAPVPARPAPAPPGPSDKPKAAKPLPQTKLEPTEPGQEPKPEHPKVVRADAVPDTHKQPAPVEPISKSKQTAQPPKESKLAGKAGGKPDASKSKDIDPELLKKKEKEKEKEAKKKAPPPPDYTGWKEVGGWDERSKLSSEEEAEDLLQRSTLLETYVTEKYYGDWYHNTALIFFTSVFSWLVARLGGGLPWLAIVLAFTATAYRTSVRRLRRNARDDLAREMGLKKLETDTETLEWLNSFLVKFWLIYEPVLSETVVATANQVLVGATPGFIDSLSLTTFTLGTKPPRVDHVRTFPKTEEDIAVMDWKFSFTPNDTEDMTAKQLKNKINPKVALGVRIGKGVVSKNLPILLEDMSFSGLMRVRIKMITTFPHVQTVDVSFLEPPKFDFVLKPIGGETFGFDINIIPGLQSFITEMVHSNIGPMMYAPNTFQLNIEQMLAGSGIESAIGVLAVTVNYAKGLKGSDAIGNTVDPYIKFSFNEREELARSGIKDNTKNPVWNETKYLLVKNLNEVLTMQIVDFNDVRKDKPIGIVNFPLETLTKKPDQDGVEAPVLAAGKNRGALQFDVHWYPVLKGRTLDDGTVEPPPDSNTGIVNFTVHQCKDLDAKRSMVGQLSPYVDMQLNDRKVHQSKTLKRTNNPVWDESFELLVTNKTKCKLGVLVRDARGLAADPIVGSYKISLDNLLAQIQDGQDWFNMTPSGRVRMSATWKPVALKDIQAGGYVEPIGVLRFFFKNATGLPNLESIGMIDPYMRVFVNSFQKGRTIHLDDTDKPVWNSVVYVTLQNARQKVFIEAMDAERNGKDRSLGSAPLDITKLVTFDENNQYLAHTENNMVGQALALERKAARGTVNYSVQFFPALNVMDPEEAEKKREEEEKAAKAREEAIARGEHPDVPAKVEQLPDEEEEEQVSSDEDSEAEDVPVEAPEKKTIEYPEPAPIVMPIEEQIKYSSGILVYMIDSIHGAEADTLLRVVVDKGAHPAYVSNKLKSGNNKLTENAEAMIRELEWSETLFEIISKESSKDVIADVAVPTINLLKEAYADEKTVTLTGRGGRQIQIKLRCRYFPVQMELDPEESINNQGSLHVDVIEAVDVPAADRSGKSDPYAVFKLNGKKIFKSKTIKKTLNPVWKESFETNIENRIRDELVCEVYDWDMGPAGDDFLGKVKIPLDELEPRSPLMLELPLDGKSGVLHLKLNFKPMYVKKRRNVGDVGTTFVGTVTDVGGVPMKMVGAAGHIAGGAAGMAGGVVGNAAGMAGGIAGNAAGMAGGIAGGAAGMAGGAAGNVAGGISKGGHFLTSKLPFGRKKDDDAASVVDTSGDVPAGDKSVDTSNGSIRHHKRIGSISSDMSGMNGGEYQPGQVTLMSMKGFDNVSHLQVRVYLAINGKREKELYKSKNVKSNGGESSIDESVSFTAPVDSKLVFKIRDHKSFGRDEELGEQSLPVAESAGNQHSVAFGDLGELQVYVNYAHSSSAA
ncbi:tricalbin-3 [Trichomonascus vanleenenianus]|uniref:tricalbin-3 n=1 Tax=Trichomonascus vanleenenianus TaxID=2268995 RepID=UPI003EC95CB4